MTEEQSRSPEEMAFGAALSELEGIVAALESEGLDLEQSLARYERGVELLRALQVKLSDAQQKVNVLLGELGAADDLGEEEA